jgi:opacity protein-like surface antigen
MVFRHRSGVLAATLLLAGAVRAAGQDHALNVFAYGGGYTALKDVNTIGTAQFRTGFAIGGGVGYEIDTNLELRATLTRAQSPLQRDGAATGVSLNRYYLAADVKAGYPFANGIRPYGFLGAGAVLLHETGSSGADRTQGFAHLGVGVAYAVGTSGLTVFTQGDGLSYSLTQLASPSFRNFSTTQFDLGWSVGASYRLPL